jgi:hypothetical protein
VCYHPKTPATTLIRSIRTYRNEYSVLTSLRRTFASQCFLAEARELSTFVHGVIVEGQFRPCKGLDVRAVRRTVSRLCCPERGRLLPFLPAKCTLRVRYPSAKCGSGLLLALRLAFAATAKAKKAPTHVFDKAVGTQSRADWLSETSEVPTGGD